MSHTKFGPDRFSRFDVYWIQTNKQTDTQTDKPNLYIDIDTGFLHNMMNRYTRYTTTEGICQLTVFIHFSKNINFCISLTFIKRTHVENLIIHTFLGGFTSFDVFTTFFIFPFLKRHSVL